MTTSATRNISSTMHWAAWLSLILAVFGLWLLVEINTHKTTPLPDETRYPVDQHDFFENSVPSQEPMAENKPTSEKMAYTDNHPEAAGHSALNDEDEVLVHTGEQIPSDLETHSQDPLASKKTFEQESMMAAIDPEPPDGEIVADSNEDPAALPNHNTVTENQTDPTTRYVSVLTGNIRQKPDNQAPTLFQLRWGQKVTVLADQGRWYHLKTPNGQKGWGHKTLFESTPPTYETITGVNGVVETIRVQMDGAKACTVFMDLDGDQPPETEVLEGEVPRLVSDFPGMMADPNILHTISVHNGLINAIRVGITDQDPLTTRVVVDLIPGVDYVVDSVFYQEEQTYALHIKAKEV